MSPHMWRSKKFSQNTNKYVVVLILLCSSFPVAPHIEFCRDWSPLRETSLDSYPLHLYSVVGNPRPDISWTHKSSLVNSSMPLTKYNSGQYEIIARNDLRVVSCSMNISVECKCESSSGDSASWCSASCKTWCFVCLIVYLSWLFSPQNRSSRTELQQELQSTRKNTFPSSLHIWWITKAWHLPLQKWNNYPTWLLSQLEW